MTIKWSSLRLHQKNLYEDWLGALITPHSQIESRGLLAS